MPMPVLSRQRCRMRSPSTPSPWKLYGLLRGLKIRLPGTLPLAYYTWLATLFLYPLLLTPRESSRRSVGKMVEPDKFEHLLDPGPDRGPRHALHPVGRRAVERLGGEGKGIVHQAVDRAVSPRGLRHRLPAELLVPEHHLGAEAHDQKHRFGARVAESLVTNIDSVGAGDLRRLMGKRAHLKHSFCDVDGSALSHGFSRSWKRPAIASPSWELD